MNREDVRFWSEGWALTGTLYSPSTPDPGGSSRPVIAVCNGFGGTMVDKEPVARPFVEAGYAVLAFDHRGWGRSEGPPGAIVPLEQVEDIRNALSFLDTRAGIARDRMGLFGVSFGGGTATYAAAVDARVRAAVSFSGVGDGERWLRGMRPTWGWAEFVRDLAEDRRTRASGGEGGRVDPFGEIMVASPERLEVRSDSAGGPTTPLASAEAIVGFRPRDVAHRIAPRAMLWICVAGDPVVPAAQSRAMYQRARPPKKLVVLPGETHYRAYETFREEIERHALDWFDRYLSSQAEAEVRQRPGRPRTGEEERR